LSYSLVSVLDNFADLGLKKELEVESNCYNFAIDVEEMIENNIFVIDYKNESFTDEYLEKYFEFNKMFTDVYNSYFSFAKTKGIYIKLREDYE